MPQPRFPRFQVSLRTFFVLLTLAAIVFGNYVRLVKRQRASVRQVQALRGYLDGWISYKSDWDMTPSDLPKRRRPSAWTNSTRKWIGVDWLEPVTFVAAPNAKPDVAYLGGLPRLQALTLETSEINDASLQTVGALRELRYLWLENTRITDQGLAHLRHLKNLRVLYLRGTETTDEGVAALEAALPRCTIHR